MLSDIEIAQRAELKPIREIAEKIGIPSEDVENYGQYKAKIPPHRREKEKQRQP